MQTLISLLFYPGGRFKVPTTLVEMFSVVLIMVTPVGLRTLGSAALSTDIAVLLQVNVDKFLSVFYIY